MSAEPASELSRRLQAALGELEGLIRAHYPEAHFRVSPSQDDPEIVHLVTTVDVEDTDAVLDVVVDRMMQLQIEEQLPIFVIPLRPPERGG